MNTHVHSVIQPNPAQRQLPKIRPDPTHRWAKLMYVFGLITPLTVLYTTPWSRKKGTTFLLWINLLTCNTILTKFTTLIVNEYYIVDVTYLISKIYTNFRTLLRRTCDVGYYIINREIDDYRLVFIVSISLLHKILNARQKLNTRNCSVYFP